MQSAGCSQRCPRRKRCTRSGGPSCTSRPHIALLPWAASHLSPLHATGRRAGSRRPMAPLRWTRQWGRSGCRPSWRRRATSQPSGPSCAPCSSPGCTAACSGEAASRRVAGRYSFPPLISKLCSLANTGPQQQAAPPAAFLPCKPFWAISGANGMQRLVCVMLC